MVSDTNGVVLSGGTANYTSVGSGSILRVDGGTVTSTAAAYEATVIVADGGAAIGTILGVGGGTEIVSAGGTVSDTVVSYGGTEIVGADGTAISTTLDGNLNHIGAGYGGDEIRVLRRHRHRDDIANGGSVYVELGGTAMQHDDRQRRLRGGLSGRQREPHNGGEQRTLICSARLSAPH